MKFLADQVHCTHNQLECVLGRPQKHSEETSLVTSAEGWSGFSWEHHFSVCSKLVPSSPTYIYGGTSVDMGSGSQPPNWMIIFLWFGLKAVIGLQKEAAVRLGILL